MSAERTQFVLSGTRQLYAGFVSGNYFDMLGARVSQGRALADFDVAAGGNAVAVLSDEAWAFEALPLSEVLALQMFPLRIASWIGAVLGAIAIVLSVSGLYGVLTYTLSARTREIGIRMALGATSGRVLRLVMLQCVRLSAWGVAAGLAVAFAAMKKRHPDAQRFRRRRGRACGRDRCRCRGSGAGGVLSCAAGDTHHSVAGASRRSLIGLRQRACLSRVTGRAHSPRPR